MQWGKRAYQPGENGGITGIVYYATTRAENDPRYAAAETWEPGIAERDGQPLERGRDRPAQHRRDRQLGRAPAHRLPGAGVHFPRRADRLLRRAEELQPGAAGRVRRRLRVHVATSRPASATARRSSGCRRATTSSRWSRRRATRSSRRRTTTSTSATRYTPASQLLPPPCVGPLHTVPDQFSLFPLVDDEGQPVAPFRAGQQTPLCNRKRVTLNDQQNAAADFFLFTYVPRGRPRRGLRARRRGQRVRPQRADLRREVRAALDADLDPRLDRPRDRAHVHRRVRRLQRARPVDLHGQPAQPERRVAEHADALHQLTDAGEPERSPTATSLDPHYNPQYSQFCYTFQFMPGTTTYLDTPVVPHGGVRRARSVPARLRARRPARRASSRSSGPTGGPYVSVANGTQTLTIAAPNATQGGTV